eukprot:CAMPEP_0172619356 /NCGR_PEP_ID=MMETSP1068-20121228/92581_1 /TAXON_ID=35684 /ORGANISM="Pseudopedinella elastica, Strain CCMP716" /LENGTH=60 /DNA_ID=CAMNT_0013426081 /DNA_START=1 /DNA_END=180 /DNA_ORIENTATION=+
MHPALLAGIKATRKDSEEISQMETGLVVGAPSTGDDASSATEVDSEVEWARLATVQDKLL